MAAPSTVAYVMQEKFQNGVPLYRQEAYWKGQGVELRRNTMANWVIRSARWFKPLYDLLRRELLRQDIVNVDETRVHVLKEDGRESKQMSQMWVFCSAEKKIALYQYLSLIHIFATNQADSMMGHAGMRRSDACTQPAASFVLADYAAETEDESYCLLWEAMNAEFEQLGAQGYPAARCVYADRCV